MANNMDDILKKYNLKSKDISAKNYEKLKFMFSDEDIKVVEKKLGVDKIAEATKSKSLPKSNLGQMGRQSRLSSDPDVAKRAKGGMINKYAKGGEVKKKKKSKKAGRLAMRGYGIARK